jgi:hypothetical protein
MATEKLDVQAGLIEWSVPHIDPETGAREGDRLVAGHAVAFSTAYGHEYTHVHPFPDTADGRSAAERLAARVQRHLDSHGVDGLDLRHWAVRTIYGSQAYIDEEPGIVWREREDALYG